MLDCNEQLQETIKDDVLCAKSNEIKIDLPSQDKTLSFNYYLLNKVLKNKYVSVDLSKLLIDNKGSLSVMAQKDQILKELYFYEKENCDLSQDERFSDAYNYRIAEFYSTIKDYQNEKKYLSLIKDKTNPTYSAKIAENLLSLNEQSDENLLFLYNLNTAESARKLSGFYLASDDYEKAESVLVHYIDTHEQISYDVYFQYAYLCIRKKDVQNAIHYMRLSFYSQNTAQSALGMSLLYLVEAIKNQKLLEKAKKWCNIAVALDISYIPALRLFTNLELEQEPDKTERILAHFLSLNTAQNTDFYPYAVINHARCSMIKEKYGEALDRYQKITDITKHQAAVWNNIAICNYSTGKPERAERNIAKSLEKYNEQIKNDCNMSDFEKKHILEIILTNYMRILNSQGKYYQTIKLYSDTEGANNFDITEDNYFGYFKQYKTALLCTEDYETFYNFIFQTFNFPSINPVIKYHCCNDMLRFLSFPEPPLEQIKECLNYLKTIFYSFPDRKYPIYFLNNIVYASLEIEEPIPSEILKAFSFTIGHNPCNTATYGLYLLRIKHETDKGISYYEKAIQMASKKPEYSYLLEELKLKRSIEAAREYIYNGDRKNAARILEATLKHCTEFYKGYKLTAEKLLKECGQ